MLSSVIPPELVDKLALAGVVALVAAVVKVWILTSRIWSLLDVKEDGRPIWYGHGKALESLAEALKSHDKTSDKQCRALDAMASKIEQLPMCLVSELMRVGVLKPGVQTCEQTPKKMKT